MVGWDDSQIPVDIHNLHKLMDETEFYELKLRRASRFDRQAGIMSLCATGCGLLIFQCDQKNVEQFIQFILGPSCAFAATYLARQMFITQKQTNIVAMMRYIRNYRHGAYTKSPDPFRHLQTIYLMLKDNLPG